MIAVRWYRLNLGDPLLADTLCEEIMRAAKAGKVALFSRHEGEGQLHCDLVVYFPNEAHALAQSYGATPCADPGSGLSPLNLG